MASLIYERKNHDTWFSTTLMLINAGFSAVCVFWWATVRYIIGDPISWAASQPMPARPDLFDFPFVVVWGLPVLAVCAGWIAIKFEQHRLGVFLLVFPMLYIGFIMACFYFMPLEWR